MMMRLGSERKILQAVLRTSQRSPLASGARFTDRAQMAVVQLPPGLETKRRQD